MSFDGLEQVGHFIVAGARPVIVDGDAYVVFIDQFIEAIEGVFRRIGRKFPHAGLLGEDEIAAIRFVILGESVDAVCRHRDGGGGGLVFHLLDLLVGRIDRQMGIEKLDVMQTEIVVDDLQGAIDRKVAQRIALDTHSKAAVLAVVVRGSQDPRRCQRGRADRRGQCAEEMAS